MSDGTDRFLDEILVNAKSEAEQLSAFAEAFEGSVRFPFPARVVGVAVRVMDVSYEAQGRRRLVARCRREGEEHTVSLVDVVAGPVTVGTAMLMEAYRRWWGMGNSDQELIRPSTCPWVYEHLATTKVTLLRPLGLRSVGLWDPADEYWAEPGEELPPLIIQIVAAGPRPEFEMDQIIPGADDDDWEVDPVADAAELHRMGADRQAIGVLEELVAGDERCIDAWVHLGNIAFDTKGLKAAVEFYDHAVAVGEQSVPEGFVGVLPWGLVDNRPFLRALYGLGLCAWRQCRWVDAEQVFLSRAWLEGAGTSGALSCLESVKARRRWSSE